ncbi:MAG TPA: DUF2147 domain-containing protein [Chitinophagales bacterium]|nr:DUF2147 domain-containing protein [Chitinophagales bacterium]
MQETKIKKINYLSTLTLGLLLSATSMAQSYSDAILGKWKSSDGKTTVEIYKSGNTYSGKIVGLQQSNDASGKPRTDLENPDASLRNRPLIGLLVLKNLKFKDGYWKDGEIYSSQNGKSYTCDIWLEGNDILKMKAYWYFMHQTEDWKRVK